MAKFSFSRGIDKFDNRPKQRATVEVPRLVASASIGGVQ